MYTNCILALEGKTGKLRWYYQFTPHDLHDWDDTEPVVLVDTKCRGRDRKRLLQANRNGYVYVLDRNNGELLLAKPFVKKLNWSSGIGPDGEPQRLPANRATKAGIKTCPAARGATKANARTGKLLWTFKGGEPWKASPMTYAVNGRQYIAVASGGNILSFALGTP